jgi:hypothetical protein
MNCKKCGKELPDGMMICDECGAELGKPENVVTGVVGALIGAVLGGASIILLSQLGFVAAISGVILAVCTLKGYELLGGRLSKRGIVISCVLMAITPYIADRLDWAIVIAQTFADEGVTLGMAFAAVHGVIAENDMVADYFSSLGMVYLFVVMGAFGTLKGLFKKK